MTQHDTADDQGKPEIPPTTRITASVRRLWHRWGRPAPAVLAGVHAALVVMGSDEDYDLTVVRYGRWWFTLVGDRLVWARTRPGLAVRMASELEDQEWRRAIMGGEDG